MATAFEVVWDGTANDGRAKQIFIKPEPAPTCQPQPMLIDRATLPPSLPEGVAAAPIRHRKRRSDDGPVPVKSAIYALLLRQDLAIGDIIEHFKDKYSKTKVYNAIASLRCSGHMKVVRREVRQRANGAGPMPRDIYGPASGVRS